MKVLKIKQNTEEWAEYRKGKSGGSEFRDLYIQKLPTKATILEYLTKKGVSLTPEDKRGTVDSLTAMLLPSEKAELKLKEEPKERYYKIIAERVARPITANDYDLDGEPFSMMARGHILEPEALAKFTEKTGRKLDDETGVWVSDFNENIYISPDGAITNKDGNIYEAVEVKCLDSAKIVKAFLTQKYPEEYKPQILKYFIVNEKLQVLHFVLYTDAIPGLEYQDFIIERREIEDELEEAKEYELMIMKKMKRDIELIESMGF